MDLALFDLDETIISEDSTGLWLHWLVSQGFAPVDILQKEQVLMSQYYQGTLSMEEYMDTTLAPLTGLATSTVSGWIRRFIQRDIVPRVYPAARERIAWHQQRGDTVMLISASGEHLVAPIAQRLGADCALAIGVEVIDGRYSGKLFGPLTYKDGKVDCINCWLSQNSARQFEKVWAYSDSINDLPMLKYADYSHVVNPGETLLEVAQERGWPVCRWTHQTS